MAAVEKVAEFSPGATGTLSAGTFASPLWSTFKKNANKNIINY